MNFNRGEVWVAGEALIDLLPGDIPVVGGGPANTAKALANLGIKSYFVGGISSDSYGEMIEENLYRSGVDLALVHRSQLPTAIAKVTLDENGSASYEFSLENTATFNFGDWLPLGSPEVLHVGTLSTIVNPGAEALFSWANTINSRIVFDPNVRPSVLGDKERYRKQFIKWVGISSIIKLSEEDLEWLDFSIEKILELGAELVVLTRGAQGLSAFRKDETFEIPGRKVEVIDTVGAGDTVGAVLVEGLINFGELKGSNLKSVLERAALAAAITCTRAGAVPPSLEELSK